MAAGLEPKLAGIPDCFQDIVYSGFFPAQLYDPLEIKAIHWQELRSQKHHREKDDFARRTGGPSYRHIREGVKNLFEIAEEVSYQEELFQEIPHLEKPFLDLAQEAGFNFGLTLQQRIQRIDLSYLFATISHDDLEDDPMHKKLIQQYKSHKNQQDRFKSELDDLEEHVDEWLLEEGLAVEIKRKRKQLKKANEAVRELSLQLESYRTEFVERRDHDFRVFLDDLCRRELRKKNRDPEKIQAVREEISDQFKESGVLLKSLTRYSEDRSYINSLYYFFDYPQRNILEVLRKSNIKTGADRLNNIGDVRKAYTAEEVEEYQELFEKESRLKEKYGSLQFKQKDLDYVQVVYLAGKSIILLNSLNRRIFNSNLPEVVEGRGYLKENIYLQMLRLAKEKLIQRTISVLEGQKEKLENYSWITQKHIAKVNGKIRDYRNAGGFDRITSEEGGDFADGIMEMITNKRRFKDNLRRIKEKKITPKEKEKERTTFFYGIVCNCLEVLFDYQRRENHTLIGMTSRLRPSSRQVG